jgi:hypothetical protein
MMKITSPNPVRSNQDSGIFRFILFCGLQEYRQGLLIICFLKGKNGQVGMTRLDFAGEDGLSLKEIVAHEQDPYNVSRPTGFRNDGQQFLLADRRHVSKGLEIRKSAQ